MSVEIHDLSAHMASDPLLARHCPLSARAGLLPFMGTRSHFYCLVWLYLPHSMTSKHQIGALIRRAISIGANWPDATKWSGIEVIACWWKSREEEAERVVRVSVKTEALHNFLTLSDESVLGNGPIADVARSFYVGNERLTL